LKRSEAQFRKDGSPLDLARAIFAELQALTAAPQMKAIADMLRALASDPGTLIVFNHPAWDEHGMGQARHLELAMLFLRAHGESIHTVELNGLWPWKENRLAWRMAQDSASRLSRAEPACARAKHAFGFDRCGLLSRICGTSARRLVGCAHHYQYREPLALRILQSVQEILRDYETHACGWRRWRDPVFTNATTGWFVR
jgi:hypothetical protein